MSIRRKRESSCADMPVLTILRGSESQTIHVAHGENLRQVLLSHGYSPYATLTARVNCGGRGLCATCGVWIEDGVPKPQHWHDWAAAYAGYPRLSCQVTIEADMTVRILDGKIIWGPRDGKRRLKLR